jgi:hypothetical protein
VAYSPDGGQLYAAFRDIKSFAGFLTDDPTGRLFKIETGTDVVVARSGDDGRSWSRPLVALAGTPYSVTYDCPAGPESCVPLDWTQGTWFDRPSLAASGSGHRGRDPHPRAGAVHVAATRLGAPDETATPTAIVVARSTNDGAHWSAPRELDTGRTSGPRVITQGPRMAAGTDGQVLVAWYHSGFDGWLAGDFEIRTARSADAGATWDPAVAAAVDGNEAGLALGPASCKGRQWWTTMLPDVAIDGAERAHVVYTRDPEAGSATAEEGDIRHVVSERTPFREWSDPVTVNDDGPGRAQGFASLVARRKGRTSFVEAVWEDTRLAPDGPPANQVFSYDVFHARLEPGAGWSANTRVTDASSTQSRRTAPGRTAVTANDTGVVFAAWGDRRGFVSLDDPASNVYGSLIDPR